MSLSEHTNDQTSAMDITKVAAGDVIELNSRNI